MFRKNEQHRQQSFLSGEYWMPPALQTGIGESWAHTFREAVFSRIDESIFAVLYSEKDSRPNSAVNVLVGAEILKSGFGWSDEQVHEQVCYNLLVRHALGLDDLRAAVFTLRTLYNFRRAIREYAAREGVNLMQRVFEQVTDNQLASLALQVGWQRMDSTQVLSNLAQWSRLELLVGVLQHVYRQLPPEVQARWQPRLGDYLAGRPHQVCYKIAAAEQTQHLEQVGRLLHALATDLTTVDADHESLLLLRRVLAEQFELHSTGEVHLRAAQDVGADSLQSPYDPEATYRVKGGKEYRGGYVLNASETADPQNKVQLIADLQVEPNHTDDGQLLQQALDNQAARHLPVQRATTDGGYTGPTAEKACAKHKVELRATRMRGGRSATAHWGWERYTWDVTDAGVPVRITCPRQVTTAVVPGRADDRYVVHFPRDACLGCPYYQHQCRVEARKRTGPGFSLPLRAIQVAQQRQALHPEDVPLRAVVEATMRELKHPFRGNQLPVRGLTRVRMLLFGSALMVNLRRIHRYLTAADLDMPVAPTSPPPDGIFVPLRTWFFCLQRLWRSFQLPDRYTPRGVY